MKQAQDPSNAQVTLLAYIEEQRQFTGYYRKLTIPETPCGGEQYAFEVGQSVKTSSSGCFKAGIPCTIATRYMDNGFCYYTLAERGLGGVMRQKDLTV